MKKKGVLVLVILIAIIVIIIGIKQNISKNSKNEITKVEAYNYFKYKDNNKFGIIDRDGKIIVEAKYKDIVIPNPEKGIFICYNSDNEKNTILNSNNEEIFSQYDNVEPIKLKNIASVLCYEKSVLKYKKDGLYGLIDFKGKEITKNQYENLENLQSTEGEFLVSKDNKYGVIDLRGRTLVEIKYDEVKTDGYYTDEEGYKKSGFIISQKTDEGYRLGYINYKGKVILKTEYYDIMRILNNEEIYLIIAKNGQYGLYKGSKEIIKPEYQSIISTDKGVLIIQKNRKYGIANLKGERLVETKYENITSKGIYLYAESSNENQVYDSNGNIVDINFSKVVYETSNENYRISTLVNNDITYYGIEDKQGATLVSPIYKYIEYIFNDNFIAKNDDGHLGIINSTGKVLLDFKFDSLQQIKGKNVVQSINKDEIEIYSSELEQKVKIKNAILDNRDGYIVIYNENETLYFNSEGNTLNRDSSEYKEIMLRNLPDEINEYKRTQMSLDNVYYEKQ